MLTERQRMILSAIIDDYVRSAEPIGSRSISKRGNVGFSPATIRNEMSDLEEMGYLGAASHVRRSYSFTQRLSLLCRSFVQARSLQVMIWTP